MKRLLLALVAALVILVSAAPEKKNVMIIGDSISIGYTPFVTEALADVANVVHNKGNAQTSTNGVEKIDSWLEGTKWDVIHFNFGLWDLCYRHPDSKAPGQRDKVNGTLSTTLEQYEANLEAVVKKLKATGAELIFCTTSYVPTEEVGRFPEDVAKYNAVAIKVMKRNKIKVNDLYKPSIAIHAENGLGVNNVHYDKEGYEALSKYVIKAISKKLK